MSVDLGSGRALRVSHYALRHGYPNERYRVQSWRLEGSNDPEGQGWTPLKEHVKDKTLPDQPCGWMVAHWEVDGVAEAYRHFRIFQTGTNSQDGKEFGRYSEHELHCAGIELYGALYLNRA